MAFFRTGGGGGIPAALKAAMNAVLNKKFGTAKTYEPNDWPDDVNLMGALEEKTASGAIAHIEDGADRVPLKNWLVTLPASLDGYSEVNGTKIASDNLLSFSGVDFTLKGVRFYSVNGVLYLDGSTVGEISSTDDAFKTNLSFYLPAGTYYLNRGTIALPTYIYDVENMTSGNAIRTNNGSFTLAEGKTLALGFYLYQKTFDDDKLDACVNVGSSAITYEDTTAPTQYTASLGRTIYGGQADIVMGEGSETYDNTSLDNLNYNYLSNITRFNVAISGADSSGYKDDIVIPTEYTISHTLITNASNAPDMTMCMYNGSLYVKNLSCTSKAELQSALSGKTLTFPLATPSDFTFTPITAETALGVNNFWADEGDSDVTYRSSGTVTTVVPTLVTKSITENGTYSAEDDDADGYSSVTVAVQSAICERLMYARCVNNDVEEIPAISNIEQGTNYASYLSYDSSTKKFTVLQDFTGVVVAWVYAYRAYDINRPDGVFYLNNTQMLSYETTANAEGSTGGRSGIYNFKQGDTFWVYTPTRHGYPQQNFKVYLVSDLNDNIFTFADETE